MSAISTAITILTLLAACEALPTSTSDISRRQDAVVTDSRAQARGQLCSVEMTQELWDTAGMPQYIRDFEVNFGPFSENLQEEMIDLIPALSADNYVCGAETPCDDTKLNDNCDANPELITMLKSMAFLTDFFRGITNKVDEVAQSVINRSGNLLQDFGGGSTTGKDNGLANGVRTALVVSQFITGFIPGLGNVKDGAGMVAGLLGIYAAPQAQPDPFADSWADLQSSLDAVKEDTKTRLRKFITDALTRTTPSEGGGLVGLISAGQFFEKMGDLSAEQLQVITASMSAPAINRAWTEAGVIVAKANIASLGFNPCEGSNIFGFPEFAHCDGDTILALMKMPSNVDNVDFAQVTDFLVPGLDQLPDFNMTTRDVVVAADKNQAANGLQGQPASNVNLIMGISQQGPDSVAAFDKADLVAFNVPVCDMTTIKLSDAQKQSCNANKFAGGSPRICEFNKLLLCGCPSTTYGDGGKKWPFPGSSNCS